MPFHELPEAGSVYDLFSRFPPAPHADIREVLCILGVIFLFLTFLLQLIPDDALRTVERLCYFRKRVSFVSQNLNVPPIRRREPRPLYSFFIRSFYALPFEYQRQSAFLFYHIRTRRFFMFRNKDFYFSSLADAINQIIMVPEAQKEIREKIKKTPVRSAEPEKYITEILNYCDSRRIINDGYTACTIRKGKEIPVREGVNYFLDEIPYQCIGGILLRYGKPSCKNPLGAMSVVRHGAYPDQDVLTRAVSVARESGGEAYWLRPTHLTTKMSGACVPDSLCMLFPTDWEIIIEKCEENIHEDGTGVRFEDIFHPPERKEGKKSLTDQTGITIIRELDIRDPAPQRDGLRKTILDALSLVPFNKTGGILLRYATIHITS